MLIHPIHPSMIQPLHPPQFANEQDFQHYSIPDSIEPQHTSCFLPYQWRARAGLGRYEFNSCRPQHEMCRSSCCSAVSGLMKLACLRRKRCVYIDIYILVSKNQVSKNQIRESLDSESGDHSNQSSIGNAVILVQAKVAWFV